MVDDRRVLQIFEQALDVPVEQRAGFLKDACGDNEDLRRDIEALLQLHEGSDTFLPETQFPPRKDLSPTSTGFARFVNNELRNALEQDPAVNAELSPQLSEADMPTQLGSYIIGDEIGRGGMGVVYEARHQTMRRRVALKVLRTGSPGRGHHLERFFREARSAGRLHHSNIVPVFEVGVDGGVHFYAMQYIHGDNLDVVIAELRQLRAQSTEHIAAERSEGTHDAAHCLLSGHFENFSVDEEFEQQSGTEEIDNLHEADSAPAAKSDPAAGSDSSSLTHVGNPDDKYFHRIARIGLQVTEALAYAHDHGILHRDIKPSNLILDRTGTVWVTDFGLATSEGEELTQTGDVVGTLRYMAPERFRGEADERSDIYSFGLTLYEMCTLRSAFDQQDRAELVHQVTNDIPPRPSQLAPSIPKDLETIISRCIAREPSARYSDAHKVADDLRLFLEDRPILARRVSFTERTWRWCRRNPGLATMLSMVVVLLVLVTCGSVVFAWRTRDYNETLLEQTVRLKRAHSETQQAYKAEQRALAESRVNLYRALYRQIQAERHNPLTSRREESLAALREAARLLPTITIPEETVAAEQLKLRTEAAAIFGQTDLVADSEKQAGGHATSSVSYTPDYDRYAVSSGYIEVYRTGDSEPLMRLPQHKHRAVDLEFSQDGRYLAALHRVEALHPRYVRVWDLQNQTVVLDVQISVNQLRFSPSLDPEAPPHLAVLSTESTVTVFPQCDVDRRIVHDYGHQVRGTDFSSDGTTLYIVGDFPLLEVWKFENDVTEASSLPAPAGSIDCGSEPNTIAVGLQSGEIRILDVRKPAQPIAVLHGHTNGVHTLSLSQDGSLVASTSWDASTRLWDVPGNREIKRLENTRLRTGFSADSRYINCISDNREAQVFRVVRNHPRRTFVDQYHLPRRNDVAIHPKFPRIAATATSGYVEFWDLQTGQLVEPLKTERAFEARISSDGTRLLTSGRRGLRLWTLNISNAAAEDESLSVSCTLERSMTGHDTYQMDCTPDLERVAFVTPDKDVVIAGIDSFEQQRTLASETDIYEVSLSPDGKWLATLSDNDFRLAVWNADTGHRIEEFGSKTRATGIAFSSDGRWLAANGVKSRLLWRVSDWQQILEVPTDSRFPGDVCFSPDNRLVAMPHDRNSLELVETATFEPVILLTSTGPQSRETVAFSSDGTKLITTCGTDFEVWDLIELRHKLRELNIDWKDAEPPDPTVP